MKKLFAALTLISGLFSSSFALAQKIEQDSVNSKMGVGIAVGSEDGISLLNKFDDDHALQGFLSIGKGFNYGSIDYLKLHPEVFGNGEGIVVPYIGVGGFYTHVEANKVFDYEDSHGKITVTDGKDQERSGVRVPFGIMVNVPKTPVQFAVELAPTLEVSPSTETYLDSMLGIRVML